MHIWHEPATHMARMNPEYIWRAEHLHLSGPGQPTDRLQVIELATICTVAKRHRVKRRHEDKQAIRHGGHRHTPACIPVRRVDGRACLTQLADLGKHACDLNGLTTTRPEAGTAGTTPVSTFSWNKATVSVLGVSALTLASFAAFNLGDWHTTEVEP